MTASPKMLLEALVGYATDSRTCGAIEQIAHDVSIETAAQREQFAELIALMAAENAYRRGIQSAIEGERYGQIEAIRRVSSGKLAYFSLAGGGSARVRDEALRWVARPLWLSEGLDILDYSSGVLEACEAETWPQARDRCPLPPTHRESPFAFSVYDVVAGPLEHVIKLRYRALAYRRLATTALAIRLFQHDHGRRPASLQELIPDYLPRLPIDPHSKDAAILGYLPNAEKPRLYSVGENEIDEGGEYGLHPSGQADRSADLPFFLDGPLPRQDVNRLMPGELQPEK
jgi:hypothetical protein